MRIYRRKDKRPRRSWLGTFVIAVIAVSAAAAAALAIAWIWYDFDSGTAIPAIAVVSHENPQTELEPSSLVRSDVSLGYGTAAAVNVRATAITRPVFNYSHPESTAPADRTHFAESIFFGDSITAAMAFYGVAAEAGVMAFAGDNPVGATERLIYIEGEHLQTPQAAKILYGERSNIYIMFSALSLTGDIEAFITGYEAFIDIVRQSFPDARIFIQSIPPTTYAAGTANQVITNERINEHNLALMYLAQQRGLIYLDIAYALTDGTGHLPPDGAPADGIHLSAEYYHIWFDYLSRHW